MKSMDKLTTGVAYGTSAGNAGFWALQLLWICPYISRHLLSLNPLQ
ncbi:hypothetical protein HEP24_022940, partial [Escherichia coli]|nr:hypothetical protein [Escherichia coli]